MTTESNHEVPVGISAFSLEGLVAAVTGTTRGIGRALAVGLSDAGAKIVHLNRSSSRSVIDEIAERGGDSVHVELDLASKDEAIRQAADAAIANYGRVDILVNCAGLVVRKPIVDQSSDEIENLLHIDLTAPLLLARAFAPHMIARG